MLWRDADACSVGLLTGCEVTVLALQVNNEGCSGSSKGADFSFCLNLFCLSLSSSEKSR